VGSKFEEVLLKRIIETRRKWRWGEGARKDVNWDLEGVGETVRKIPNTTTHQPK
jgi:hypothetical protein